MNARAPAVHTEIEVRFAVPAASRKAVRKLFEPGVREVQGMTLRAYYFDTPQRHLAQAGMALRVRREGHRWIQTLKTAGAGAIARNEHVSAVTGPRLDLDALGATPLADVLGTAEALGSLEVRFETRIRRRVRRIRVRGATIEAALDEGTLLAGLEPLPVCELELELVRGSPAALFAFAQRWQHRFGLVLEVRSKAERGDALACGAEPPGPRRAAPIRLARSTRPAAALQAMVLECADQIARNATPLALGTGGDEHVHQLRVGIRRLRSALRFCQGWVPPAPPAIAEGARALFRELGSSRDLAVALGDVEPRIVAAGMPPLPPEAAAPGRAPALVAADAAHQGWLLALLAWGDSLAGDAAGPSTPGDTAPTAPGDTATAPPGGTTPAKPPSLERLVRRRLDRWHERIAVTARTFAGLDVEARHALRKRAKRLRYALEFSAGLVPDAPRRRYLRRLARVQEALGELNDLALAVARYERLRGSEPQAWFALGWIAARRAAVEALAAQAVERLRDAGPLG